MLILKYTSVYVSNFQVKLATDAGLVIFCWGDDNNDKDTIKKLKEMGLHAVIYDKLDQFTTKQVKVTFAFINFNNKSYTKIG